MPSRLVVAAVFVCLLVSATDSSAQDQHAQLLASADQVAKKVAKLRGLRAKRKIRRGVMDKAQLKARILKRVHQEYSSAKLASQQLLLKRFGFLAPSQDYLKLTVALLTDRLAGFYDPWEKQLYIAGFGTASSEAMAHEIDHALQDQHFNLRALMAKGKGNSDRSVARSALVEGDGMALMIEFMLAEKGQPAQWGNQHMTTAILERLGSKSGLGPRPSTPLFLREGLLFPYQAGLAFVAHFRRHQPWSRINRIYRKPPLSSEQVLHPKKYERYERPDEVSAVPLAALPGAQVRHQDVQGEFGLRTWLLTHGVNRPRAELAAAGWGGDRIAILAPATATLPSETVGIELSVWDGEADAIEFYEAAADALAAMLGPGKQVGDATLFDRGADRAALVRHGDRVVIVIAPKSAGRVRAIADEALKTWTVRRR